MIKDNKVLNKYLLFEKQKGYHEKGMLLEKALTRALDILKIPNGHNHFDKRYCHDDGVDNTIATCRGNIETECKNLNGKHLLSTTWLLEEVIDRYSYKPFKKILTISILNVNRKVRRWLERHVRIVELGYQVTKHNFNRAIHDLVKKLYYVKIKYLKYIQPKPKNKPTKLSHFDKCLLYSIIDVVGCGFGFNGCNVSFKHIEGQCDI